MALLDEGSFAEAQHRESSRPNNVSSRLTDDETRQLGCHWPKSAGCSAANSSASSSFASPATPD